MNCISTIIKDCYIIEWDSFSDDRGYFNVPFNGDEFKKQTGLSPNFIQENESFSKKGTIRGLHFQKQPYEQAKLVRCIKGHVLDVVVDLRTDSGSFGKVLTFDLSENHNRSVFVPRGCAHGFSALEDSIFQYKIDNEYNKKSEGGVIYNDPDLSINWQVKDIPLISDKDLELPFFKDFDIYY